MRVAGIVHTPAGRSILSPRPPRRAARPAYAARSPVSEVTSGDVLEVLTPIWHEKAQTARRVRQRVRAVLEWAVAMELRPDNPCDRIGPVLGPQRAPVQHMRALPHRDVPAAVEAVRTSGAAPVVKLAFELLVLTAARWGEVRGAEWAEIDSSGRVWTIPAARMKAQRAHRVPLCRRAAEILEAARTLGAGSGPPSGTGQPKKRTTRARLSRPRSRTWCRTKSRPPMRGRTCSSAGGGSWTSGQPTSMATADRRSRQKAGEKWNT